MRALPLVGILAALWLMVGRDGVSDVRSRIRSIEALRPYQPDHMCGTGGLQWSYRVSPEVADRVASELRAKGWAASKDGSSLSNDDQGGRVRMSATDDRQTARVTVSFGL